MSNNNNSSNYYKLEPARKALKIGMQAQTEMDDLFVRGTTLAINRNLFYKRGGQYCPKIRNYAQNMITFLELLGMRALMAQDLKRHLAHVLRLLRRLQSTSFAKPAEALRQVLLTLQDVTAEELCYDYPTSDTQHAEIYTFLEKVSNSMRLNPVERTSEQNGTNGRGTRFVWRLEELQDTLPFTQKYLERFKRNFTDSTTAFETPTRYKVTTMGSYLVDSIPFTSDEDGDHDGNSCAGPHDVRSEHEGSYSLSSATTAASTALLSASSETASSHNTPERSNSSPTSTLMLTPKSNSRSRSKPRPTPRSKPRSNSGSKPRSTPRPKPRSNSGSKSGTKSRSKSRSNSDSTSCLNLSSKSTSLTQMLERKQNTSDPAHSNTDACTVEPIPIYEAPEEFCHEVQVQEAPKRLRTSIRNESETTGTPAPNSTLHSSEQNSTDKLTQEILCLTLESLRSEDLHDPGDDDFMCDLTKALQHYAATNPSFWGENCPN